AGLATRGVTSVAGSMTSGELSWYGAVEALADPFSGAPERSFAGSLLEISARAGWGATAGMIGRSAAVGWGSLLVFPDTEIPSGLAAVAGGLVCTACGVRS